MEGGGSGRRACRACVWGECLSGGGQGRGWGMLFCSCFFLADRPSKIGAGREKMMQRRWKRCDNFCDRLRLLRYLRWRQSLAPNGAKKNGNVTLTSKNPLCFLPSKNWTFTASTVGGSTTESWKRSNSNHSPMPSRDQKVFGSLSSST